MIILIRTRLKGLIRGQIKDLSSQLRETWSLDGKAGQAICPPSHADENGRFAITVPFLYAADRCAVQRGSTGCETPYIIPRQGGRFKKFLVCGANVVTAEHARASWVHVSFLGTVRFSRPYGTMARLASLPSTEVLG